MVDLADISTAELLSDLVETNADIELCKTALMMEVTAYSGGLVADRLKVNERIKAIIKAELERRGVNVLEVTNE